MANVGRLADEPPVKEMAVLKGAAQVGSIRCNWNDCFGLMNEPSATRIVCITNQRGLHARPAELFARRAMEFQSKIEIIKDGQRVDGRSILHILTLGATCGTELVLEARGEDAEAALGALAELVGSDFGAYDQNEKQ